MPCFRNGLKTFIQLKFRNWRNYTNFTDCYGELCYNNLFIKFVIVPVVAADFENNGIDGIKFLFSCFRGHDRLYNNANSPLSIFVTLLIISTIPYSWLIKSLKRNPKTLKC